MQDKHRTKASQLEDSKLAYSNHSLVDIMHSPQYLKQISPFSGKNKVGFVASLDQK
jgi:hypothetical protein